MCYAKLELDSRGSGLPGLCGFGWGLTAGGISGLVAGTPGVAGSGFLVGAVGAWGSVGPTGGRVGTAVEGSSSGLGFWSELFGGVCYLQRGRCVWAGVVRHSVCQTQHRVNERGYRHPGGCKTGSM